MFKVNKMIQQKKFLFNKFSSVKKNNNLKIALYEAEIFSFFTLEEIKKLEKCCFYQH